MSTKAPETVQSPSTGNAPKENVPKIPASEAKELAKWQRKLLPFMLRMLIGLTAFFFVASCIELYLLDQRINKDHNLDLKPVLDALDSQGGEITEAGKLERVRWKTLAMLEANVLERRYHQANGLLISRIWTGYLGFVTGMTLALVGATFILGKLQEGTTQMSADSSMWKVSISSASPGLILALLGTILMVTTMLSHRRIDVTDNQIYTNGWTHSREVRASQPGDPEPFGTEPDDTVIPTSSTPVATPDGKSVATPTGRK